LHLQPCYRRHYGDLNLPGAERYYARCLSLPLFPTMSACDVERVIDALGACLRAGPTP
jgi:dTDP-4-amino-4,6-dideoxygalactose transaminase